MPPDGGDPLSEDYPVLTYIAAFIKDGIQAGLAPAGHHTNEGTACGPGTVGWEEAGCALWDMAASEGCARSMLRLQVLITVQSYRSPLLYFD